MRLAEQIKEYVKCPQTGSNDYGRWGLLLRSSERIWVDKLCDQCLMFEETADKFGKENLILKEALNLACNYIAGDWDGTSFGKEVEKVGGYANYFKNKAREKLYGNIEN